VIQTQPTDIFHIILGVLAGFLSHFYPLCYISLLITVVFFFYEVLEREPLRETYFDLVEYEVGFIIGYLSCPGAL